MEENTTEISFRKRTIRASRSGRRCAVARGDAVRRSSQAYSAQHDGLNSPVRSGRQLHSGGWARDPQFAGVLPRRRRDQTVRRFEHPVRSLDASSGWNGNFRASATAATPDPSASAGWGCGVARLRDRLHRYRPSRRAGQTRAGRSGHPEKIVDFGYRAIHETAGQGQGDHSRILWRRAQALLFQLLLERRPAGA